MVGIVLVLDNRGRETVMHCMVYAAGRRNGPWGRAKSKWGS